jgi:serine/threonine protein kinase
MVGRVFLNRYEAIRLLGEGGMGRVYLAKQTDLGRQVVVKVMHDHIALDPKFRDRFQRETLMMARFQHPYVVTLYDASLNDPQGPCIVMEYIRGITLDTLLQRNNRLSPERTARLLGQLCEALQAAHQEGIIHRDLKPANLMVVDPDTPYEKIKVMDFGLAKLLDNQAMSRPKSTDTGADFAVGTPGYISPEQVRGDELTHRSDLYSVGVIIYELLTGRLPFAGSETMDVLLAHATEPPPSFTAIGATWLSSAIEAVVLSCLAKNAEERPAGARELWESYEKALTQPIVPPTPDAAAEQDTVPVPAASRPATAADASAVTHHMEAWMPDAIASYKLRGFVNDMGGEVLESVPGMIRVRIGGKGSTYRGNGGALAWLGIGRNFSVVDVELHLQRNHPTQENLLDVTVVMRSPERNAVANPAWRARCDRIFCDLRAYLAGAVIANT